MIYHRSSHGGYLTIHDILTIQGDMLSLRALRVLKGLNTLQMLHMILFIIDITQNISTIYPAREHESIQDDTLTVTLMIFLTDVGFMNMIPSDSINPTCCVSNI